MHQHCYSTWMLFAGAWLCRAWCKQQHTLPNETRKAGMMNRTSKQIDATLHVKYMTTTHINPDTLKQHFWNAAATSTHILQMLQVLRLHLLLLMLVSPARNTASTTTAISITTVIIVSNATATNMTTDKHLYSTWRPSAGAWLCQLWFKQQAQGSAKT